MVVVAGAAKVTKPEVKKAQRAKGTDLMVMRCTVGEPLPLIVTISQERLLTLGTKYIYKIYY